MDTIDELSTALARFPGIGPRQAKRCVFYLLSAPPSERAKLLDLIGSLGKNVRQCEQCLRFYNGSSTICNYCKDSARTNAQLMVVEKDQDLAAIERAGTYRGRYFVLGGVLTLTGKGAIREKELSKTLERKSKEGLLEVILALSATSEGEHTADRLRELLLPYRDTLKIYTLGRGLSTGSELEYSDAETLRAALSNRKES